MQPNTPREELRADFDDVMAFAGDDPAALNLIGATLKTLLSATKQTHSPEKSQ